MSESPSSRAQGVTDSLAHLPAEEDETESEAESSSGSESESETEEEDSNDGKPGSKVLSVETASAPPSPSALKSSSKNNSSSSKAKKTSTPKKGDKKAVQTPKSKKTTPPKTPGTGGAASTSTTPKSGAKTTYLMMVHEAIVALKDRSGSSQIAISKYILAQYPNLFGPQFKSRLSMAIKTGVKQARFVKIRASFKINPEWTKKEKAKQKAKVAAAAAAAKKKKLQQQKLKKKKTAAEEAKEKAEREKKRKEQREKKLKEKEKSMSAEELAALRKRQARQKAAEKKRQEEIRRKKEIAEKIRKRKYPIEDTKLHKEDKEWGVKAPPEVKRRPPLPYLSLAVIPYDQRSQKSKKPSQTVVNATKCEHLDYGSRGLASDLFQVFHFFRGDVAYGCGSLGNKQDSLVPEFQIVHLLHAVEEIHNGNSKKSRTVPPLIQHLFVTALRLLCAPPSEDEEANMNRRESSLRKDLSKLGPGLRPTSWAEICFQYMDVMERYYTSKLSEDDNVLPGGYVDIEYLMRAKDDVAMISPVKKIREVGTGGGQLNSVFLPEGYSGYLGDRRGSLSRAHAKLEIKDPWFLSAEELMSLLRALVDDILATKDDICRDIAERDEQMYELLKAKKAADSHFRKTRLAFEGPKQPSRAKPKPKAIAEKEKEEGENTGNGEKSADHSDTDISKKEDDGDSNAEKENKPEQEAPPVFKPTVSKRQYDTAIKAQQKATEAYEKGLRKLVSRREPIGQDRNFNSVYFFNHDPDMIYIEVSKGSNNQDDDSFPVDMQTKKTNWHILDSKTLFDQYVASLDVRGSRENDLYEELMGPMGGSYSLKRFMYDDMKEQTVLNGVKREEAELQRRLENARLACAAEEAEGGRRSGRLASRAQIDFMQVEQEIEILTRRKEELTAPKIVDYEVMTGLDMLREFDNVDRRETRRTREQKAASEAKEHFPKMPCSTLLGTGHIDGTGIVGAIVSDMLKVEELCETLAPWDSKDIDRKLWISNLEEAVHAWNSGSQLLLGPSVSRDTGTPSFIPNDSQDTPNDCGTSVATPDVGSKRMSSEVSTSISESKRAKLEISPVSSASFAQVLSMLRTPILSLEKRVYEIIGYAKATQDADDADGNMSVGSNEDEQETEEGKKKLIWKKKIHSLRSIPTHRYGQIREILVEAIAAARKAHDADVVAELRASLLLHHPNAAGECKSTAIAILDKYGGYDDEDDEDSDDEAEVEEKDQTETEEDDKIPTVLSGEAMMLNGSVKGDDHANRVDWIDAVKACKTLSRFAALANAFIRTALDTLKKTEAENRTLYEALGVWEKEEERKKRTRTGKTSQKKKSIDHFDSSTEVWANVRYTDDFCMAKIDDYPTWPARKCEAKDPELAKLLLAANRILINLIGEDGSIRVIEMADILPYTGKAVEEDLGNFRKANRAQFEECLAISRRIYRGIKKKQSGSRGSRIVEEKKSAI